MMPGMALIMDAAAFAVLFAVQMTLLPLGEVAVVLGHIALLLILDAILSILVMPDLVSIELAVFDAIINAVLLVVLTVIYLVDAGMARDVAVILRKYGRRKHCAHKKARDKESLDTVFHKFMIPF
jgi:hypothetical protein